MRVEWKWYRGEKIGVWKSWGTGGLRMVLPAVIWPTNKNEVNGCVPYYQIWWRIYRREVL